MFVHVIPGNLLLVNLKSVIKGCRPYQELSYFDFARRLAKLMYPVDIVFFLKPTITSQLVYIHFLKATLLWIIKRNVIAGNMPILSFIHFLTKPMAYAFSQQVFCNYGKKM